MTTVALARLRGTEVTEVLTVHERPHLRPRGTIGLPVISGEVAVGWRWDGTAFHPPGTDVAVLKRRRNMQLTMLQFLKGLRDKSWISESEASAWATGAALPAIAEAVIATLPAAVRPRARLTLHRMSVVLRTDPLLTAIAAHPSAAALGVTEAALDQLFREYRDA